MSHTYLSGCAMIVLYLHINTNNGVLSTSRNNIFRKKRLYCGTLNIESVFKLKKAVTIVILLLVVAIVVFTVPEISEPVLQQVHKVGAYVSNSALLNIYIADPPPRRNFTPPFEINYEYVSMTIDKIVLAGAGNETVTETGIGITVKLYANGSYVQVAGNIYLPAGAEIKHILLVCRNITVHLEDGTVVATCRQALTIHILVEAAGALERGKVYALCIDVAFDVPKVIAPLGAPFAIVAGSVFATASLVPET